MTDPRFGDNVLRGSELHLRGPDILANTFNPGAK
jgi:hypothetical protein